MTFSKKAILLSGILLCAFVQLGAQVRQTREEYISRYMPIAIAHMERYGIPASITMAQGILESDCGNSLLSMKSNNHFGIKCKRNWTGDKVYHDDDAKANASGPTPRSRRRTGTTPNSSTRSPATTRCSPTPPTIIRAGRGASRPRATPRPPTMRSGSSASSRRISFSCSTGPTAHGSTPRGSG